MHRVSRPTEFVGTHAMQQIRTGYQLPQKTQFVCGLTGRVAGAIEPLVVFQDALSYRFFQATIIGIALANNYMALQCAPIILT